jgi:hypothetical protein
MTDEIHMPFDRVAIAYRRAMAELLSSGSGAFLVAPVLADA